jgi:hypothetical protein
LRYHRLLMSASWYWAVALVGGCARAFAQANAPPPELTILMQFDRQPAKGVIESMQREVAKILSPAGVSIVWRPTENNRGTESFPNLVVLHFTGRCQNRPPGELWEQLGVHYELASSAVRNRGVLPFAKIQCDNVVNLLQPWQAAKQSITVGIAMGRVVVHELYHMMTNTIAHGQGLLSKESVTRDELKTRDANLSSEELQLFRGSIH